MNAIDFRQPPSIGTVVQIDNQSFELIRTEPHRRKDGTPSSLLSWSTNCPVCGVEFVVMTGLVTKALNRRCEAHRQPLKPVSGRRRKVKVAISEP